MTQCILINWPVRDGVGDKWTCPGITMKCVQ